MRRLRYKEIYTFFLLFILTAVFVGLFVVRLGVFGSKVDWISQHSVLPDYFRRQFYETGELFPEFAFNIGGGQNIYHFAYYGLYSPVLLFSYLFPFISMSDYMMLAQFFGLAASVLLLYGWLQKRGISKKISFFTGLIFLLSGPMIYHSYNQIMFVNYMPFLCMGFLGVDQYFDGQSGKTGEGGKHSGLLLISVFLMILTSFYFSIGGMLALVLYGIHRYIEVCGQKKEALTFKRFMLEGVKFAVPFLLAVMLSGILLVPAATALMGREGSVPDVSGAELFFPEVSLDRFFYSPYGIGLTTLGFTALISMLFFRKLQERILAAGSILILTIPVFAWLLNGGLYIRDKVMIPFLPLLCYMTAYYLSSLERERKKYKAAVFFPYLTPLAAAYLGRLKGDVGKYWELVFFDGAVMLICFFLFQRKPYGKRNSLVLLVPSVILLVSYGAGLHKEADYVIDREFYKGIMDKDAKELIKEITEKENGFYRIEQLGTDEENAANINRIQDMHQFISSIYSSSYNKEYLDFRRDTFGAEEPFRNFLMQSSLRNPIYQDFMGVKYLVSREEPEGCNLIECKGQQKVYENRDALPLAYATDKVMDEEDYKSLEFPYNQLALREYAVVLKKGKKEVSKTLQSKVKQINVNLPQTISERKNTEYLLYVPEADSDMEGDRQKIIFLQFHVKNLKPSEDITIWAEGTRNKLTSEHHFYRNNNTNFMYAVFLDKGQTKISMTFGKGTYKISDVKCFVGILPEPTDTSLETAEAPGDEGSLCQAEFQTEWKKTKGNVIAGKIETERKGYFITSIPYDKNFEIRVDGKKTEGERVNTAFLGCRLKKGKHEIEIIYHAPGVQVGKMLSLAGAAVILGIILCRRRRKRFLL